MDQRNRQGRRAELVLTLVAPDGNQAHVVVEARSGVEPRDIDCLGADRNPASDPEDTRLKSLRGRASARVVRFLLDSREAVGVRELAARAQASPATTAKVLELLDREDLIERDDRGAVSDVRKRSLVGRWAQDYGFTSTNRTQRALSPRGLDALLSRMGTYEQPVALTGSAALRAYLPRDELAVTPMALLAVYVDDFEHALRALGLRAARRGANVLLAEPHDDAVFADARVINGLRYASPSQTVVDLLTSPGRGPAEADQLLDVLAADNTGWSK